MVIPAGVYGARLKLAQYVLRYEYNKYGVVNAHDRYTLYTIPHFASGRFGGVAFNRHYAAILLTFVCRNISYIPESDK